MVALVFVCEFFSPSYRVVVEVVTPLSIMSVRFFFNVYIRSNVDGDRLGEFEGLRIAYFEASCALL